MSTEQLAPLTSSDAPINVPNRRGRVSDLERGSAMLSHATQYLMSEPFHTQDTPAATNNGALSILFEAGRKLYKMERRLPSRELMGSWLQTIAYMRAGLELPQTAEASYAEQAPN